jgi:hypothetical protein
MNNVSINISVEGSHTKIKEKKYKYIGSEKEKLNKYSNLNAVVGEKTKYTSLLSSAFRALKSAE